MINRSNIIVHSEYCGAYLAYLLDLSAFVCGQFIFPSLELIPSPYPNERLLQLPVFCDDATYIFL
jgi:hypothetical protein